MAANEALSPAPETAKPFAVELSDLENNVKRIAVRVYKDKVNETLSQEFRDIQRHGQIPGFRSGKAPMKLIEARFGNMVRPQAMQKLFQELLPEIFDDIDIDPLGMPEIDGKLDIDNEGEFRFAIQVQIQPGFDPVDYKQVEVQVKKLSVDEILKQEVKNLLRKHATETALEDTPLAAGMKFHVLFVATVDGKLLGESGTQELEGILGEDDLLEGTPLMADLTGKKAGESITIDYVVPETHHSEGLRGKRLEGTVRLLEVFEVVMPELNDAFVKEKLGEEKTWAVYEKDLREKIEIQVESYRKKTATDKVVTRALAANPIDLSDAIVEAELQQRRDYYQLNEQAKMYLRLLARRRLTGEILFKNIVRVEGMEVSGEEFEQAVRSRAETVHQEYEDVLAEVKAKKQESDIKNDILQRRVLDLLYKEAIVREVDEPTDENMDLNVAKLLTGDDDDDHDHGHDHGHDHDHGHHHHH